MHAYSLPARERPKTLEVEWEVQPEEDGLKSVCKGNPLNISEKYNRIQFRKVR